MVNKQLSRFRFLIGIVIVAIIALITQSSSFASKADDDSVSTTSSEIVKHLKAEEKSPDGLTEKERSAIIENSTKQARDDYLELVLDQASKKIEEENPMLKDGEEYLKKTFPLDCCAKVEVTLQDEAESSDDPTFTPSSWEHNHTDYVGYKDYGKRKYTARFNAIANIGTWLIFRVTNHYTISNKGLSIRSVESEYNNGTYVKRVDSGSKIEDAYAAKEGTDINCIGRIKYEVEIPVIGGSVATLNVKLRNYVRLEKLEKKNKRAKVTCHCKSWHTKTYAW